MFRKNFKNSYNKTTIIMAGIILFICFMPSILINEQSNTEKIIKETKNGTKQITKLDIIDYYQDKFFEIITRNDVLLSMENNEYVHKDLNDLSQLFEKVEHKINSQNEYFKRYKEIEEKYKDNFGENILEMSTFALQNYELIDELFNDTYKEVKIKLKDSELDELKNNQEEWFNKVLSYEQHVKSQDLGSIEQLVNLNSQILMKSFRTLLLMMYL